MPKGLRKGGWFLAEISGVKECSQALNSPFVAKHGTRES